MHQRDRDERIMKQRLELEREKLLQQELDNIEKERRFKRGQIAIKKCGILEAYDWIVDELMKKG